MIRSRLALFMALSTGTLGCTGTSASTEPEPQAEPEPPEPAAHGPSSPAELAAAPWRSVWPAEDSVVSTADQPGRLLHMGGISPASPTGACEGLTRWQGPPAVLWLPAGQEQTFNPAAAVSAALVERSAWRLDEVGEPTNAVEPGVTAPDPALHKGIRVRSVRKIRRQGPPYRLVLGERGDQVLIGLTDREAQTLHDGLALKRPDRTPLTWGIIPAGDLDGDEHPEVVVYGDGSQGGFRAVLSVHTLHGTLSLRTYEVSGPVDCGQQP